MGSGNPMCPSRKPNLKTGPKVQPFYGMLVLPYISEHAPEQYEENCHNFQERMSVYERQVCRLVDADDLWTRCTHHAISESLPTPCVVMQGISGTAIQDIGAPIQGNTQRQMGMRLLRSALPSAPDS